ncbi:MAG: hypothetical protein Tsb005_13400 [Gammaproteobacteria bacterium]
MFRPSSLNVDFYKSEKQVDETLLKTILTWFDDSALTDEEVFEKLTQLRVSLDSAKYEFRSNFVKDYGLGYSRITQSIDIPLTMIAAVIGRKKLSTRLAVAIRLVIEEEQQALQNLFENYADLLSPSLISELLYQAAKHNRYELVKYFCEKHNAIVHYNYIDEWTCQGLLCDLIDLQVWQPERKKIIDYLLEH